MKIDVRLAQQADLEELQGLFLEENRFHAALVPEYIRATDDVLRPAELADFIEAQDKALFVAESGKQLAGAVIVLLVRPSGNRWERLTDYGYINDLIVRTTAQGQGIGTLLVETAIRWVESQGVSAVELHVWESNHGAIRLYESMQFRSVQRRMKLPLNGDRVTSVTDNDGYTEMASCEVGLYLLLSRGGQHGTGTGSLRAIPQPPLWSK